MSKKAVVVPARGIGDALLMMIASEALHREGFSVTTIHPALAELQSWFPHQRFSREIPPDDPVDLLIIENDNSCATFRFKQKANVSIFYPTYFEKKHGPLSPLDQCFDPTRPFAHNMQEAIGRLLGKKSLSKENGMKIPTHLVHRRFQKRVVLHPMSSADEKNWPQEKYCALACKLKKAGYDPHFIMSLEEKKRWESEFPLLAFPNLSELAAFTYESGYLIGNDSLLGHLASNLGLPTLIIADDIKRMALWRPDWTPGMVVTPFSWIPKRMRKKKWKRWISSRRVFRAFCHLAGHG